MNRETLDDIVKRGLVAYMAEMDAGIGRECSSPEFMTDRDCPAWALGRITEREHAQKLLQDDKARLEIVDRILEEMKRTPQ